VLTTTYATSLAGRAVTGQGWLLGLAALAMIASLVPANAPAQALWRGVDAGASPEAVRAAVPDATPPLALTTLADGETDDLVTHAFQWNDRLMEVRFFFREAKLAAVQLSPIVAPGDTAANRRLAHDLAGAITADRGAPYECGDKDYADVALYECKWLAPPLVIRLWYEDVAGQAPTLRIAIRKAGDISYDF
jgi:hypothetical protein